jgi:uncharacterized membrane protein
MIKRIFITGLAAIVPVVITVYVIIGLFTFADTILGKFFNKILQSYTGYKIPGIGIIITILIVFIVGALVQFSRIRIFRWLEKIFFNLPLINKIYFPIKRVVNFLFFPPKKTFKNAVLVEYPRKGIYSLGFITNEGFHEFNKKTGKKLYNVFIPSSPSPLTGFTIIVSEEDLVFLEISVEEAIKLIISGGLLNPNE